LFFGDGGSGVWGGRGGGVGGWGAHPGASKRLLERLHVVVLLFLLALVSLINCRCRCQGALSSEFTSIPAGSQCPCPDLSALHLPCIFWPDASASHPASTTAADAAPSQRMNPHTPSRAAQELPVIEGADPNPRHAKGVDMAAWILLFRDWRRSRASVGWPSS
jgi:hypothetical protein